MTDKEKLARKVLGNMTLEDLLNMWELTANSINSSEAFMVRVWVMNELESRNPNAFNKWLNQACPTDESLRNYMMTM